MSYTQLKIWSENWAARETWLGSLLAELWKSRGPFPGLPKVMDYLSYSAGVAYWVDETKTNRSPEHLREQLFDALDGLAPPDPLAGKSLESARRKWRYLEPIQQELLREVLPRFDLTTQQVADVIERPESVSIWSTPEAIVDNPYILCEEHEGEGPDDVISFSRVDHGLLPDPNVGAALVEADDPRRLER